MPVDYTILPDRSPTVIRHEGAVTHGDILDSFRAYQADPAYSGGTPELADLRGVSSVEMGFAQVQALFTAVNDAYTQQGILTRISVFAPDELPYGMLRLLHALASKGTEVQVHVAWTETETLGWLGRAERSLAELPTGG